jgi:hypothetical protein
MGRYDCVSRLKTRTNTGDSLVKNAIMNYTEPVPGRLVNYRIKA